MKDLDFIDDLFPEETNPAITEADKKDWEDFWENEDI
jgi:hypothetical protein